MRMNIDPFGPDVTLHHIGLVVASINVVVPDDEVSFDPIQKVKGAFLLAPGDAGRTDRTSGRRLAGDAELRKGTKLVHFCYEVDNLKAAIELCTKDGFPCIAKPVPAVALYKRHIAWVFHLVFGPFELLER